MATKDPFRSGSKNARGMGSAHEGVHHWKAQRVSAVAMLGLAVWFVYFIALVAKTGGSYDYAIFLLQQPLHTIGAILFIATGLYHGTIGVQVVFEDYIHHTCFRTIKIVGSRYLAIILGVAAILSLLKIYFNG